MKFYSTLTEACLALGWPAPDEARLAAERQFPFFTTQYYLDLIDRSAGWSDPIARQLLPDPAEIADDTAEFDPLAENRQMPCDGVIRRFADRVVLLATTQCAARCRFCFRKRFWASDGENRAALSPEKLEAAAHWLASEPEIREVLVSGGDPLMLAPERLLEIVHRLTAIPNVEVIRIGSRIPVVWPQRMTAELAAALGEVPGLWFATHFNHPREVTAESMAACARLIRAGVPVINQSVLLHGVNDDPAVLEELFRRLIRNRIKPHYLFHVDPVRGVRHFATGVEKGLEMLRYFRPRLSSLAVPTFALDLPGGGGKVALQPDWRGEGGYWDIHGRITVPYYPESD